MEPSDKIRVDSRWNENLEGADKHLPIRDRRIRPIRGLARPAWGPEEYRSLALILNLNLGSLAFFPRHEVAGRA
jgi:hypothetical protein